jgi:hypothetical protein
MTRPGKERPEREEETSRERTELGEGSAALGKSDHSFTLQAIMELKGSMGELKSSFNSLRDAIEGMKSKVDDLVSWKNRILGGAVVVGAVLTVAAFFIGKFFEYVTIKSPTAQVQTQSATPEPRAVPPGKPPVKPTKP